jgi:curved DNA-binding protein CbpA
MAMKFHPDRNQTPHSAEAFKLVSAAYVTLSDAQKRKLYDQYGTDDEHTLHQRRSPFGQRMNVNGQTFTFGQDDDDIFFDLFANLFGGIPQDVMQQRMRMRHQQGMHRQHRHRQQQPQMQTQQGFGFYIVQIGVILFIILSSVLNFSVFSNNPNSSAPAHSNAYYSFQKSNHHPMLREMHVSREIKIPYFVAPNVNHQLNSNMWAKRQVESEVYHNYGPYLQNKCNEEQLVKEKKIQEGSSASSGDERWKSMQTAEQMPLPHCDLLHRFKSKVH